MEDHIFFLLMFVVNIYYGLGQCVMHNTTNDFTLGIIISTPNYPHENYENNMSLCWRVNTLSTTLCLTTKDVELEAGYDYLEVFTGADDGSHTTITGHHSGVGEPICTKVPYITTVFASDISVTKRGFQACICQEHVSCQCDWLQGFSEDEGDDNNNAMTPGTIAAITTGVIMCVAIPLISVILICCCDKCKTEAAHHSSAESEVDLSLYITHHRRHGVPKPNNRVVPMQPPPYTPSGPPSYEDVIQGRADIPRPVAPTDTDIPRPVAPTGTDMPRPGAPTATEISQTSPTNGVGNFRPHPPHHPPTYSSNSHADIEVPTNDTDRRSVDGNGNVSNIGLTGGPVSATLPHVQ